MELDHYFAALRRAHGGQLPLNSDQRQAIEHRFTHPLWIIAGPGTGKTHTLVWLVLKRILVDGVPPSRIILTTFTRKAATELQSRLILSRQHLIDAGIDEAESIDISQIVLGTLHSICSRILQDQRYEPTLRIRVLNDELAQQFFLRRTRNPLVQSGSISLWQRFGMVGKDDIYSPAQALKAEYAAKLFNRITENRANIQSMLSCGEQDFIALAQGYQAYQEALHTEHRTDQAHLQAHFLAFLETSAGKAWMNDGHDQAGFTLVVDEYQDTNPIQEQIYFKLASLTGDITVVGDDDQSLYRFRGATVESLIDFDQACQHYLGAQPAQVNLRENRRSHPTIVNWVNRFIECHPLMKDTTVRVRAPYKRSLVAASSVNGSYPAVMAIAEPTYLKSAQKVVQTISELMNEGLVEDYSQIALLTFSTRETSQGVGQFTDALRNNGIPLYNPRNGKAHKDALFLQMLGALIQILDPDGRGVPTQLPRNVPEYIQLARDAYTNLVASGAHRDVRDYVEASANAVRQARIDSTKNANYLVRKGGRRVSISGLLYKLLAHEPFATGLNEAEASARLKAFNLILAEYEALYDNGELKLEQQSDGTSAIRSWTLHNFYAVFVEGIHDKLNDPEDDEVSIQPGAVNVMTIHQSKGLEFEVVFVLRPDKQPWVSDTHMMEDVFDPFTAWPTKPTKRRPCDLRAAEDAVRLFFVAYSRAKRLLVIAGNTEIQKWERVLGYDAHGKAIDSRSTLQQAGVHLL